MTIGTIQSFERSRNGAPKLKIDGKYYFVGKTNIDGLGVGDKVDFTSNTFGDRGLLGLMTCVPARAAQNVPPQSNGHAAPAAVFDGDMLRYASNVVANAIQAGLIKAPRDITPWFWAAMDCPKASDDEEPPFNDEIP